VKQDGIDDVHRTGVCGMRSATHWTMRSRRSKRHDAMAGASLTAIGR